MKKKTGLFKGSEQKSRVEVSDFLKQLNEKVADGQVILRRPSGDLVLDLPENLGLQVKVTQKNKPKQGIQYKLTLKLNWREGAYEDTLSLG